MYCISVSSRPSPSHTEMEAVAHDEPGRVGMGTKEVSQSRRRSISVLLIKYHRFEEFLRSDGPLLLKEDDPRVQQVQKVTQRIICAIEDPDVERHIVSAASRIWPPPEEISGNGQLGQDAQVSERIRFDFPPSARAAGSTVEMPFRPESSNPYKVFESTDWKLYVVDLVS